MEDGYMILAESIVLQAVEDYRKALRGYDICKIKPERMIQLLEEFFRSEWYMLLTKVDGETIIKRLKEEYSNESNTYTSNT